MKNSSSKTTLFLIELCIVILVFSVCAAVSLKIFTSASNMSDNSARLNAGVLAVQSVAECFKETGDAQKIAEVLEGRADGEKAILSYDKNWQTTQADMPTYEVVLEQKDNVAVICAYDKKDNEEIFSLKVKYIGGGM